MVARLSRTLCHQVCGWKRSSWTMQPPESIAAIDENASAFMWLSGSGVMKRSTSGTTSAQLVAGRGTTRRRAGSSRWRGGSPSAGRWCPRCRAARTRCCGRSARGARRAGVRAAGMRPATSGRIVSSVDAGLGRGGAQAALARRQRRPPATISLWPIR